MRYTYSYGYKNIEAAFNAIEDMYADGTVSQCEKPKVENYKTKDGKRLYKVTILDNL